MTSPARKFLLAAMALLVLLPLLAYWAADAWLESAGGRRMLEKELSNRIGMPVRLEDEFDLMLLPDIGVSGTGLSIGRESETQVFAYGREYEISVALGPLLDRQVRVDWIRLTGGEIHPDRYEKPAGTEPAGPGSGFRLPEIRELAVRDFGVALPGDGGQIVRITELTLNGFADGRDTPFTLELEGLATVAGRLRWTSGHPVMHFSGLHIDLAGQSVMGAACLYLDDRVSLHAEFEAELIDMDAVMETLPGMAGTGNDAVEGEGMEIRLRLEAEELKSSGAVARGVVVSLGRQPRCD